MGLTVDVQRALDLSLEEAGLRATARLVELDPARRAEAGRLFRSASALRRQRLELLARAGLL